MHRTHTANWIARYFFLFQTYAHQFEKQDMKYSQSNSTSLKLFWESEKNQEKS